MKTPAEVRTIAARRFKASCRRWLAGRLGLPDDSVWPMTVPLGIPSEREVLSNPGKVLAWRDAWMAEVDARRIGVSITSRDWTACGRQTVPDKAVFDSVEDVARAAGEIRTWNRTLERARTLLALRAGIEAEIVHAWSVLADWEDRDFEILLSALEWLAANPKSGLYVRQLPVEGMDTKWLTAPRQTAIKSLLGAWWREAGEPVPEAQDFEAFCGLRTKPSPVRMRLLDPADRAVLHGLSDLSAPVDEIAALPLHPRIVFISENEQSGLAFEDMPGAVLFLGLGRSVTQLLAVSWIHDAKVVYWGDADTWGLQILASVRRCFPGTVSVLMDEETLVRWRDYAVEEPRQAPEADCAGLHDGEAALWKALKNDMYGTRLRLEQERIPWAEARAALQKAAG